MWPGIALRVHPLVLELTGKKTPQTGLDGKFSVYHSAAVAVIHGRAGEHQYSDAEVRNTLTIALRDKVSATVDTAIPAHAVDITMTLVDGRVLHKHVANAIGSVERPMSDAALDAKFNDQVDAGAAGGSRGASCWRPAAPCRTRRMWRRSRGWLLRPDASTVGRSRRALPRPERGTPVQQGRVTESREDSPCP